MVLSIPLKVYIYTGAGLKVVLFLFNHRKKDIDHSIRNLMVKLIRLRNAWEINEAYFWIALACLGGLTLGCYAGV